MHKTATLALLCWVVACDLTLPERTCSTSSDCESYEFCSPSGFCLNWDPEWEDADVSSQDGVDAEDLVNCEPGETLCNNRQILICNEDGESTTDGDLCGSDQRCRAGVARCVDRCTDYGIGCESDGDCTGGPDCTDGELGCLNSVCVTTPPGESGAPCWDDFECGAATPHCYEPGDICQTGEVDEPCLSADDCAESLSCYLGDSTTGTCSTGYEGSLCLSGEDCQAPLVCGPDGECRSGLAGESCTDDSHCSTAAPVCGPVSRACHRGEEGDDCDSNDDCRAPAIFCGSDSYCYDGSLGDPCEDTDDNCAPGTPLCGPNGCQVGVYGDTCLETEDCEPAEHYCMDSFCYDGRAGSPCANDDGYCATGSSLCGPAGCQPGIEYQPCVDDDDCDAEQSMVCASVGLCHDRGEGDPCGGASDCQSGICEGDVCGAGGGS